VSGSQPGILNLKNKPKIERGAVNGCLKKGRMSGKLSKQKRGAQSKGGKNIRDKQKKTTTNTGKKDGQEKKAL